MTPKTENRDSPIQIGIIGHITSGYKSGHFLRIKELRPEDPPSYLALTAEDHEFRANGEDIWVEDFTALTQLFAEACWVVSWEDTPSARSTRGVRRPFSVGVTGIACYLRNARRLASD